MLFFILLICVLGLLGCNKQPNKASLIPIDTLNTDVIFDDIFFDEIANTEFLIKIIWNEDEARAIRNLDFYSFNDGKIEKIKQINFKTPYNFYSYLIHTNDSIFTTPYRRNILCLFNSAGDLVNKWDLDIFDYPLKN